MAANPDTQKQKRASGRVLIVSLPPEIFGGVGAMTRILADFLRSKGYEITIAYYATHGHRPELNASLMQGSVFRKPQSRTEINFTDHRCVAVGCRLPELEFTYTKPSPLWQGLIDSHDFHIAAGGTVAVAAPLAAAKIPYLVWCASDVQGDRADRQAAMSIVRRVFDKTVVTPGLQAQEKKVLQGQGKVLAISPYTVNRLTAMAPDPANEIDLLPIPTDMSDMVPPRQTPDMTKLGFAGRLTDPRKNASLLFEAVEAVRKAGVNVVLEVTGSSNAVLDAEIERRGLRGAVRFRGILSKEELRAFYQGLGAFIIPSHQEGLSIVGIEAMACGVPVISTRCGGPEAFVRDGENGFLTDFDSTEMAGRISEICTNPELRQRLSGAARECVENNYGFEKFEQGLKQVWHDVWHTAL